MELNKKLNQEVINWLEKLQGNEPVNPLGFLKQTGGLKQQVLEAVRKSVPRSVKTGMPFDPQHAATVEAIEANADKIREKLWDLVYKGDVSSETLNNEMIELLAQIMPKPQLAAVDGCPSCIMCVACVGCVTCIGCAVCLVTGVEALIAASFLVTAASSASAAAAK